MEFHHHNNHPDPFVNMAIMLVLISASTILGMIDIGETLKLIATVLQIASYGTAIIVGYVTIKKLNKKE